VKIGLYFGSFNPIHVGHLIIASHVLSVTDIEKVWFVVSPHNPLKESKSLLNENHRLHLVRLAIEEEPNFMASNIEFTLPKPSYTIDTLTYLKEKYPTNEFTVIMGGDSLQNLPKWKNYEQLLDQYNILVYQRPGFTNNMLQHKNVAILPAPLLELSATAIRNLIKEDKSVRYMLTEPVRKYIEASGYYK
jgi:nicotinate-nucleotide adenylyltransferase